MLHRIRLELTVLLAVAISVTALVFALTDDSAPAAIAEPQPSVSSTADIPDDARQVEIFEFQYDPDPVRVPAGTTVAWTNSDLAQHTVTADDGSWDSGYMDEGDTFALTFDEPGVYTYYCVLHPPRQVALGAADGDELVLGGGGHGMSGTIMVE